jgi:hypothetical protein
MYTVAYQVTDSYCVDYANYASGEYRPKIYLQASHNGLTATYTPYNKYGYWIDTEIPTNPLFTTKNRDFLYIDDETLTVNSVRIARDWKTLYGGTSNTIWVKAMDLDGNGVPGVVMHFTSSNGETLANGTTNDDGYAYTILNISGTPGTITISSHVGDTPATSDSYAFTASYNTGTSFLAVKLVSQAFELARAGDSLPQSIKILAVQADGTVNGSQSGTYQIECSDPTGDVGSTGFTTASNGTYTLTYTPTVVGRYVCKFTVSSAIKEVGWSIVERF